MFGILFPFGGFAKVPDRFHLFIQEAVTDLSRALSIHMRLRRSVLHFTAMSGSPQPPCSFGHWRVVTGTRKMAPCQMNQVQTLVNCCVYVLRGVRICATYQIFANRHSCMYFTHWARHKLLAYAFCAHARTDLVTRAQVSFVESSVVFPKVTPSILTFVLNSIPKTDAGAVHLSMASALDFLG